MAGFIGGRTSAFDYIGPDLPNNPQNGEMWFDTDGASDGSGEVKVYDGESGAWEATGFTSHADLTDVTRSAHHPPVDVSGPLTQPSDQSLGLSIGDGLLDSNGTLVADLGNGLGIDSNGQVYVPASAVEQSMLAFDTATQAELDGHAGDTTNPHNVTDDQTGAASALSNHSGDASAHHSRYSDTEARNATDGVIDADTVDGKEASQLQMWVKDGSTTVSGSSYVTYYMNSNWDEVMVRVTDFSTGSSGTYVALQVNGDTGSNYNYIKVDGSKTTGKGRAIVGYMENGERQTSGELQLDGRWSEGFTFSNQLRSYTSDAAQVGRDSSVTSPLSQFTLRSTTNEDFSATVEVFGRDT